MNIIDSKMSQPNPNNNTVNQSMPYPMEDYHTKQRYEKLIQFINMVFDNQNYRIESLPGDASFRRYHRIYLQPEKEVNETSQATALDPSYIVMDAPPELESIESFVRIDELMAPKINVPTLLAKDVEQGFLVLQDFGSIEFAHLVADAKSKQNSGRVDELYRWAIDTILNLQSLDVNEAQRHFDVADYDAAILQREMDLFSGWFLPYIGVSLESEKDTDSVSQDSLSEDSLNEDSLNEDKVVWQNFTQGLIDLILKQPTVVVHRDYHSRNLMQDQYHSNKLGVIDFQDALIGSYTYDLISLVRDAYVDWTESQIESWIEYYWQQRKQLGLTLPDTLSDFTNDVNLMGVQRHLKVLGIFVRLAKRDGKLRYLADIPKVWRDLMVEVQRLAQCDGSDQKSIEIRALVQPFAQWLTHKVEPKFNTAVWSA